MLRRELGRIRPCPLTHLTRPPSAPSLSPTSHLPSLSAMTSSTSYPVGMFPVPRDPLAYLPSPAAVLLDAPATLNLHLNDLAIPVTDIITQAKDYLKNELSVPIWNHSHRSYLFGELSPLVSTHARSFGAHRLAGSFSPAPSGSAIASLHLPGDSKYAFDPESLYLACLFHDIGCTEQNIKKSGPSSQAHRALR